METILLSNDGRCKWLENRVLKKILPQMLEAKRMNNKPMYIIADWISNDSGKVGVDLKWLDKLGVSVVNNYKEIVDTNCIVVNTGYDSIVNEEIELRQKGVEILDEPCPYVRKVRTIFENPEPTFQYVLLCEPNHIIVKNFASIFPKDMILVQMKNYKEKIINQENGKPICLVPYVTFLPKHIKEIMDFIDNNFSERKNKFIQTSCMWLSSPTSPIVEINNMSEKSLENVKDAILIATAGSVNKSLVSLIETLEDRNLNVVKISSLTQFILYSIKHKKSKVLVVRSPIPNNAEIPIINCIQHGIFYAYINCFVQFMKYSLFKGGKGK
ncbi:MAG: hypothetical protein K1W37_10405 [Lachnospiraceae bacterium]|jgi:uncharacterized UPF0160 family protein